jgi:hypothetical protein
MAGNLMEWTADVYEDYGAPCWNGEPVRDPLCWYSSGRRFTLRGGSYADGIADLRGAWRTGADGEASTRGMRCVRESKFALVNETSLRWDATDISTVSRGSNRFDAFTIEGGRLIYHEWDGASWKGTPLGIPPDVARLKKVAAVVVPTSGGERLAVFATGSDGHIYYRLQSNADSGSATANFGSWITDGAISEPVVDPDKKIGATSRGVDRIDVFWVTPSSNLGHASAKDLVWTGTESGDTPNLTWLQIPMGHKFVNSLTVTSWGVGHLDVYFPVLSEGTIYLEHHWWDTGSGHRETIELPELASASNDRMSVVAVAHGERARELFLNGANLAVAPGSKLWRSPSPSAPPARQLYVDYVPGPSEASHRSVQSVTLTDDGARTDLWGISNGAAWRAQFSN